MKLKLSSPKTITFIIALVIAVIGLLIALGVFNLLFAAEWWALIAFALLALGTLLKGL